jgi:hypothetical protein
LFGFGQVVEKFRNGRDFIGFLGHAELSQDEPGIGRTTVTSSSAFPTRSTA